MLRSLGLVRSLLGVQVGANEEILLKNCLWDIMNNRIFFQHPDLARCLAVHETVMQLMVHTLAKAAVDQPCGSATGGSGAVQSGTGLPGEPGQEGMLTGAGGLPALMEEATLYLIERLKDRVLILYLKEEDLACKPSDGFYLKRGRISRRPEHRVKAKRLEYNGNQASSSGSVHSVRL
ncbi:unnamed protein product [Protopolystoma xenopodis]|uniref:RIH domain-containing protein n=1 Tax=Protopolystoma xenopodis TaxID=117903 RepID=A0A3S5CPT7_9PLAT|nr:unnamed protein product [Protopolystoma xenopodis]